MRVVHPVAAERRIVRVDEHGEVLGARRSPKRATAVAVFDKLVAFPSLLTHPNLTVEVLLCARTTSAARSRRDAGGGPATRGAAAGRGPRPRRPCARPDDILALLPAAPGRAVHHARARAPSPAARCSPSARSTACGRRHRRARGQARARAALRALPLSVVSRRRRHRRAQRRVRGAPALPRRRRARLAVDRADVGERVAPPARPPDVLAEPNRSVLVMAAPLSPRLTPDATPRRRAGSTARR